MALWAKAQTLPTEIFEKIRTIYSGEYFPLEVRYCLASFIEEKFCTDVDFGADNAQFEKYVGGLVNSLIQEIENQAAGMDSGEENSFTKFKLTETAKLLRQNYSASPMRLYNYVKQCLVSEMTLVHAASGDGFVSMANMNISSSAADIQHKLEDLRHRIQETGADLRRIEQEQEAISYHENSLLSAHIQQNTNTSRNQQTAEVLQKMLNEKEQLQQVLSQKISGLLQGRLILVEKVKENLQLLNSLHSKVLNNELLRWKREQQLAGNGASFNSNLDAIQEWCEILADVIWLTRQQIKDLERLKQKLPLEAPGLPSVLPHLLAEVTQLLTSLVNISFIIEKQPPQVIKTNTRFTATVRLLVGGKLNVHMTPPQVKVTIIPETQVNLLLTLGKLNKSSDASGEILNNTETMEYQRTTRQLSVSFRNMRLKKINRAGKRGTESVINEKFSLLFQSQFSVGGGELTYRSWTLSLPVVVIVHGNQEPHAWATITWDNAFSEPVRTPFIVPDKVAWSSVAETLSLKFWSSTGRALTLENLSFLGEKAFRGNYTDASQTLSWAKFCKEPLPDHNFTFWEWFYAVMKLTREHLREPWVDGAIMGFIRRKQTEEMLSSCSNGTFLLRFSDSELGGVTIAWVSETGEVFMLQPFTSKDFDVRSLADRISDLSHLTYLYRDIPKDVAFNKYYTPLQNNQPCGGRNGYVKLFLKTNVPGINRPISYGGTPQHPIIQSPDPTRDTPSVASSYTGPIATTMTAQDSTGMEYIDQSNENIDFNGLVNLNELMQGYGQ